MSARPPHPLTLLYGEAPPTDLRRDNTALVVVDMQYFDAHPDWGEGRTVKQVGAEAAFAYYFERLQEIIPNIQALLATSREAGVEVIHLRVSELTEDARDVGRKQAVRGLLRAALLEGGRAAGGGRGRGRRDRRLEVVLRACSPGPTWTACSRRWASRTWSSAARPPTAASRAPSRTRPTWGTAACWSRTPAPPGSEEGHERALARLDGGPNVVVSTAEMTARLAELGLEPVPARREALAKHLARPRRPRPRRRPQRPVQADLRRAAAPVAGPRGRRRSS